MQSFLIVSLEVMLCKFYCQRHSTVLYLVRDQRYHCFVFVFSHSLSSLFGFSRKNPLQCQAQSFQWNGWPRNSRRSSTDLPPCLLMDLQLHYLLFFRSLISPRLHYIHNRYQSLTCTNLHPYLCLRKSKQLRLHTQRPNEQKFQSTYLYSV